MAPAARSARVLRREGGGGGGEGRAPAASSFPPTAEARSRGFSRALASLPREAVARLRAAEAGAGA